MITNVGLVKFRDICSDVGSLSVVEGTRDIPFEIKRVYYITRVPNNTRRGFHSHKKLHQVLLCLNGSVKIEVFNGNKSEIVELNDPTCGLYIGPMVWREMYDFSEGAVLMVLASEYYDEMDYERDFIRYVKEAEEFFDNK